MVKYEEDSVKLEEERENLDKIFYTFTDENTQKIYENNPSMPKPRVPRIESVKDIDGKPKYTKKRRVKSTIFVIAVVMYFVISNIMNTSKGETTQLNPLIFFSIVAIVFGIGIYRKIVEKPYGYMFSIIDKKVERYTDLESDNEKLVRNLFRQHTREYDDVFTINNLFKYPSIFTDNSLLLMYYFYYKVLDKRVEKGTLEYGINLDVEVPIKDGKQFNTITKLAYVLRKIFNFGAISVVVAIFLVLLPLSYLLLYDKVPEFTTFVLLIIQLVVAYVFLMVAFIVVFGLVNKTNISRITKDKYKNRQLININKIIDSNLKYIFDEMQNGKLASELTEEILYELNEVKDDVIDKELKIEVGKDTLNKLTKQERKELIEQFNLDTKQYGWEHVLYDEDNPYQKDKYEKLKKSSDTLNMNYDFLRFYILVSIKTRTKMIRKMFRWSNS